MYIQVIELLNRKKVHWRPALLCITNYIKTNKTVIKQEQIHSILLHAALGVDYMFLRLLESMNI